MRVEFIWIDWINHETQGQVTLKPEKIPQTRNDIYVFQIIKQK